MTEAEFLNALLTTLPNLGIGIIFLYLYLSERRRNTTMTEQIIQMYKESITASKEIRFALDNNTEAVKALTQKVDKPWPTH